jgi:hypothetical protein
MIIQTVRLLEIIMNKLDISSEWNNSNSSLNEIINDVSTVISERLWTDSIPNNIDKTLSTKRLVTLVITLSQFIQFGHSSKNVTSSQLTDQFLLGDVNTDNPFQTNDQATNLDINQVNIEVGSTIIDPSMSETPNHDNKELLNQLTKAYELIAILKVSGSYNSISFNYFYIFWLTLLLCPFCLC